MNASQRDEFINSGPPVGKILLSMPLVTSALMSVLSGKGKRLQGAAIGGGLGIGGLAGGALGAHVGSTLNPANPLAGHEGAMVGGTLGMIAGHEGARYLLDPKGYADSFKQKEEEDDTKEAYVQGFIDKCAAVGVDPEALLKASQPTVENVKDKVVGFAGKARDKYNKAVTKFGPNANLPPIRKKLDPRDYADG